MFSKVLMVRQFSSSWYGGLPWNLSAMRVKPVAVVPSGTMSRRLKIALPLLSVKDSLIA